MLQVKKMTFARGWSVRSFLFLLLLYILPTYAKQDSSRLYSRYTALGEERLRYYAGLSNGSQLDPKPGHGRPTHLEQVLIQRTSGTENNTRVRNYISSQFKNIDWHIEEDSFTDKTPVGNRSFTNLIVTADPAAAKRLVLAAHFDSKYYAPGHEFLGATDSAVACAILIDLAISLDKELKRARAASKSDVSASEDDLDFDDGECTHDTTLQLIFFDGEEAFRDWTSTDSIYGSRHLAQRWQDELVSNNLGGCNAGQIVNKLAGIETFVLLDLLGAQDPTIMASSYETSWAFQSLIDIESRLAQHGLWEDMQSSSLPSINAPGVKTGPKPSQAKAYRSFFRPLPSQGLLSAGIEDDHIPFMARGVPILHIIPFPFPAVWHTSGDNADAVHLPTTRNWNLLMRIFVAENLALDSSLTKESMQSESKEHVERDLVGVIANRPGPISDLWH